MRKILRRSSFLPQGLLFLLVTLLVAACGNSGNSPSPTSTAITYHPIVLQVVDAGGFKSQYQPMLEAYKNAHPDQISQIVYPDRIQAPNLPGRLQAEEDAGRVLDNLIISGYDGVASSVQQGLVEKLRPNFASNFPNLDQNYLPAAKQYTDLAKGYALVWSYTPSGPIFEYDPTKVPTPPQTIDELKTWILAHPGQFLYARPSNSGPGRTMLMGLPYLLHDSDPKDPTKGWDKTWQFLHDIGGTIGSYPTSTKVTMTSLANGTVSMIASTLGWDINPRSLSQVPKGDKTFVLQDTTFVADAAFMMMPKGLDQNTHQIILNVMASILTPKQQAFNYDDGYFYPGPAIKNVPLTIAPAASQQTIQNYGRPEYDTLIKQVKIVMPLDTGPLVSAFSKWDSDIGANKFKTS